MILRQEKATESKSDCLCNPLLPPTHLNFTLVFLSPPIVKTIVDYCFRSDPCPNGTANWLYVAGICCLVSNS